MKRKNSDIFYNSLFAIGGFLICYISLEYRFFKIDTEINVIESLLTLASIIVGLFIAMSLQKRYNRNQNSYNYLISKLDRLWSDFTDFSLQVEIADQMEINRFASKIRDFQKKNDDLDKLLVQLEITNEFSNLSERLLETFESCEVQNNVGIYRTKKSDILSLNRDVIDNFVHVFNSLNNI